MGQLICSDVDIRLSLEQQLAPQSLLARYRCYDSHPQLVDKPWVLVLGGISASSEVLDADSDGYWPGLLDVFNAEHTPARPVNLLSIDYLNGLGGSELLSSKVDIATQARFFSGVCQALGIDQLAAVWGGSYGGVVALAMASQRHLKIDRVIALACAEKSTINAALGRRFQRELLAQGEAQQAPQQAIILARALAMQSYRGKDELQQRFSDAEQAWQYLNARAQALWQQHGERLARLFSEFGESLDHYCIDPQQVACAVLVIGFSSDQLVPPKIVQEFAKQLPMLAGVHVIDTPYGHDGFLKETPHYGRYCLKFLSQPSDTDAFSCTVLERSESRTEAL